LDGSNQVSTRSIWCGSIRRTSREKSVKFTINKTAEVTATAPVKNMTAIIFQSTPDKTIKTTVINKKTSVVPKSGCFHTRKAGAIVLNKIFPINHKSVLIV